MLLLCPILHETFLRLTAKITLIIIFCNLYMPYKSSAVLCMLDAVFGFDYYLNLIEVVSISQITFL